MSQLLETSRQALVLLFTGDPALWSIVSISFSVSLRAILIATPLAFLLAFVLAYTRFPGRRVLISTFNTLLALPAVVVGLTMQKETRNGQSLIFGGRSRILQSRSMRITLWV